MEKEDLVRKLNSVGKQAFVENFNLLKKYTCGQLSRERAIDELVRREVSNVSGADIRAGNAKLIFEAHRELDALDIILESLRVPASVRKEAGRLKSEIA